MYRDGLTRGEAEDDEPGVRCVVHDGQGRSRWVRDNRLSCDDRRIVDLHRSAFNRPATRGSARSTPTAPLVASAKASMTKG